MDGSTAADYAEGICNEATWMMAALTDNMGYCRLQPDGAFAPSLAYQSLVRACLCLSVSLSVLCLSVSFSAAACLCVYVSLFVSLSVCCMGNGLIRLIRLIVTGGV